MPNCKGFDDQGECCIYTAPKGQPLCLRCTAALAAMPSNGAAHPPTPPTPPAQTPPAQPAPPATPAQPWSCAKCTYDNSPSRPTCEICQSTVRAPPKCSSAASAAAGGTENSFAWIAQFDNACYVLCFINAIMIAMEKMGVTLDFTEPTYNSLWQETVAAAKANDQAKCRECVQNWLIALSKISVDGSFCTKRQDDFYRISWCFEQITTNLSTVGSAPRKIVVCGLDGLPGYETTSHVVHHGAHWSAYLDEPLDGVHAMAVGDTATVYCIAVANPDKKWNCRSCTLENENDKNRCEICETER